MKDFARSMLHHSRALSLAGILALCSSALWAQADGPMGPPPDGSPPGDVQQSHGPSVERELKQLTQLLTLTTAQQTEVKDILTDRHRQIESLLHAQTTADSNGPPSRETMEALRASMKSIREASQVKLVALLSDTQKTVYASWEKKHARSAAQQESEDMPPPPPDGDGGPPPDGGGPGGGSGGGPGGGGPPGN